MENSTYDKQDEIFDQVEPYFLSFAGKMNLKKIKIGRWRWDTPNLSLTWEENCLQRSISALVISDSEVRIECNTWKDEGKTRKWRNLCVGQAVAAVENIVLFNNG